MTVHFPQGGMDFLADLAAHNERAWFQANKKRYEAELKAPSWALVEAINAELAQISPAHVTPPGKAISRINRDTRFSQDKTPYRTQVWGGFHDATRPKGGAAGFYFGISPVGVGVGAGLWMAPKDELGRLRSYIAEHPAQLLAILADLRPEYGEVQGEKLKRVPRPWDLEHPGAELLKHKGLFVKRDLGLELATSERLVPTLAARFRELLPLVRYLDAALDRGPSYVR